MKATFICGMLSILIGGCAHQQPVPADEAFSPAIPWVRQSKALVELEERHAHISEFRSHFSESRQLHDVSALEALTQVKRFSGRERAAHRHWFSKAASVIFFSTETQFSGICFLDSAGYATHVLLFG